MSTSPPKVDVQRAEKIWARYCAEHDTSKLKDQAAAIEPVSGRIWFGESAIDVREKMLADGIVAPAYLIRVGYDHYLRKGGRR
jgi:hypothetical protein